MLGTSDISLITDLLFESEGEIDEGVIDGVLGTLQATGDVLLGNRSNPRYHSSGNVTPPPPPRAPMRTDPARSTYRDANMPRSGPMSPDTSPASYYGRGSLGQAYDMRNADNARTGYKPSQSPLSRMDTYHQDPREFESPESGESPPVEPDQGDKRQTHRYGHPVADNGAPKPKFVIRKPQPPVSAYDEGTMTITDVVDELVDSDCAGGEEIDEFFGELMKGAGSLVGGLAGGAVSAGAQALGGAARSGVGGAFNKAFSGMGMRSNVGSQVGSQIGQKIGGAANTFGQGMVSTAGSAISKGISSVGSMFSGNKNPTGSFGMGGDSSTPGGGVLRPGVNTSVASTPTATNAATGQPVNTAYRQ